MNAIAPIPVDDPLQMAWLDCNDLGNAERLRLVVRALLAAYPNPETNK